MGLSIQASAEVLQTIQAVHTAACSITTILGSPLNPEVKDLGSLIYPNASIICVSLNLWFMGLSIQGPKERSTTSLGPWIDKPMNHKFSETHIIDALG
jgi:hypothetical protein